ncbi:MAG: 4a-hydroxytetrahydrobiopterin dehydratase [Polyangia bacterium]
MKRKPLEETRSLRKPNKPLEEDELASRVDSLVGGWSVVEGHHLEKEFVFPGFRGALDFAFEVGKLAEVSDHYPELKISWGKTVIALWTRSAGGLTEIDFAFASRCDAAHEKLRGGAVSG